MGLTRRHLFERTHDEVYILLADTMTSQVQSLDATKMPWRSYFCYRLLEENTA
jgi:hypothetical protein